MRIVLRSDVEGLGRKGDICDVADGYARNYLVPRGLALRSSPGLERQAVVMRQAAATARAASLADAEAIARRLAPTVLQVSARAADSGRLYGSVGPADVVAAVQRQLGVAVERQSVRLEAPIRSVGEHTVEFRLHERVIVPVTLEVAAE